MDSKGVIVSDEKKKIVKTTEINVDNAKPEEKKKSKYITMKDVVPFNRPIEQKDLENAVKKLKEK